MANEFIIRKGYKSLANSEITGSLNVTVDITGSAFKGDGSALTGVTAEWDGSHTGNASITGDLSAQGFHIDGASLETYHDFQSKPIDTDSGLFTIGGHGMQNGYTRALSLWSSTDGVWNSWIGTNLRWDGTNFKRASNNGGQNWGNVSGIRFLGNSATTGASMQFVVNPPAQTSAPSGEQTVGTAVPSSWTALSIDNDKKVTTHGALTSLGDANFNGYLQAHSTFYVRSIIQVMNKAANGFLTLGNRNTSGTEVVYDLGYIGTITAAGKISGGELEGTSLDINGNADISGNLSGVDTLTATTLSVTNYGLVSGDIPNNAADTTGNADTSTTAGSAAKLTDGGSLTSQPGQNNLIHTGQINAGTSGLFATSDNSNSVITLNRHSGNYDSQLGFSSNGNLYYRKFSNSTAFTTQVWKQLAFTDSNITGNAATVTTNANLTGMVTSVGNATSLGSFTTAELNAAISDGSINSQSDFVSAANGGTFSGTVTINKDGDALNLRSVTNGQPTNLTFSTNVPDSQIGHIKYSHSNSASYGGGDSFTIGGTETTTVILADGQLMYKDGIYSKPATGTGSGTRKDSNWDTAYNHSQATHAPTNAEANVQSDWNATSGDALILNKPTIPSGNSIIDWTADQGSTNIHVNNVVGYINSTEPNEPFNPFAGQKFHDGVLTNALAGRHDRFVVTIDGTVETGASLKLSNQNFEEYNQNRLFGTSAGETKVFNINVQSLASGSPNSSGITYSAGFFDINFYSTPFPASWSARVKNKNGAWNPVTSLTKIGNSKLRGVIPISNYLTDIEFSLTARTSAPFVTGNITYGISEFELFFSRMTAAQGGNISSLGGYLGGTITTAGGTTSTNWNSAYGWGDHSLAGYSTATGVANNAEVNVQSDWNETSATSDALILNKPTTLAGYGITDSPNLHEWEWFWVRYANNVTVATDTQANWEAAYKTYFINETAAEEDEGYVNTIDDVGTDGGFGGSTYGNIFGNLSSYHTLITTNIHVTEPFTVSITDFNGDDSHAIFIDGAYVKGVKACCSNSSYSYTFTQGWHRIDLIYGEGGGGDFIKMGWNPKDYTDNISHMYAHLGADNPNYTLERLKAIDGAGSGLDADLLDGQEGTHYLDYNNFSNTPTVPTSYAPTDAEANVQSDWNETTTTSDAFILNKPTIPSVPSSYAPTDAEANVQADWNETTTTSDAFILNKPTIPAAITDYVSKASGGTFGGAITVSGELEATSLDINGNADISGNLLLGSAGTENFISFAGTTGDTGGTTFIGEYLYGGTEQSELILYKGNDGHASTASPDRIRMIGANLCFDVYNVAQSYPTTMAGVAGLTTIRALTIDQTKLATFTGNISLSGTGIKSIQSGGDIALKTSTGEYALYGAANGNTNLYYNGVQHFRTGPDGVVVTGDVAVGGNKYTLTVNAPTNLTTSVVNDTINVTFTASTTTNIDNYLVFSSIAGGDYGLISVIPPADFGATMSIIDDSFNAGGTQAYRVYAVKNGVYSSPLTGSQTFTVGTIEPSNLSVINLNTAYYIQYDAPSAKGRFVASYNIYKHEHATASSLDRNSASLVYSGINNSFMYGISGVDNNNFHQFWVEVTTA